MNFDVYYFFAFNASCISVSKSAGFTLEPYLFIGFPVLSIRNLVKFHLISSVIAPDRLFFKYYK